MAGASHRDGEAAPQEDHAGADRQGREHRRSSEAGDELGNVYEERGPMHREESEARRVGNRHAVVLGDVVARGTEHGNRARERGQAAHRGHETPTAEPEPFLNSRKPAEKVAQMHRATVMVDRGCSLDAAGRLTGC
jgi:hypothetical protein